MGVMGDEKRYIWSRDDDEAGGAKKETDEELWFLPLKLTYLPPHFVMTITTAYHIIIQQYTTVNDSDYSWNKCIPYLPLL